MRILLVLILLVYAVEAFRQPKIHSETNQIQEHANIGQFIELEEHDTVVLKCSGPHGELKYTFPNMEDHTGFDEDSFNGRILETDDDAFGDRVLTITDVQESDTGAYSCISVEHSSLNSSIYLFVHKSKTFLPLKPSMFIYNKGEVIVPCRTTKFVSDEDIELYANDNIIKDAFKSYDQRIGFKITDKMYDMKPTEMVAFKCKHKKEKDQEKAFIISEKETEIDSDKDLQFYWEDGFDWPHVGYNYTRTCVLQYNGSNLENFDHYENVLHIQCPQCQNGHAVVTKAKSGGKRLVLQVEISHLELEDSGKYECIWSKFSKIIENPPTRVFELHVAPQEAQIRVIERSPQLLKVNENHEVSLSAKFGIYPIGEEKYTAKWSRRYNSSIKGGPQSETLVDDVFRTITSKSFDNGVFSETLVMNDAAVRTSMSGTYVLSISYLKTVQVLQWEVEIENDEPDVQITVREPSSFIVFNQQFYPPDTHLHIDCVSVSIPPTDVVFEIKDSEDSDFQEIDPSSLVRIEGTFEKGYIWNMTLERNTELRCVSEKRGKRTSTLKTVFVADEAPEISSVIEKSNAATDSEDSKMIYEGDNVKLTCIVPNSAKDWDVTWRFADSHSPETSSLPAEIHEVGLSKHVVLNLYDIAVGSSGKYHCVVKKGESEEILETVVKVEKISKPFHSAGDSGHVVHADFDQTFVIDCHMDGKPTPVYSWYKDGNPYTIGEKNGRLLTVTRARAEDDGQFHCLATNRAGSTSHFIEVQVEGAPKKTSFFYWFVLALAIVAMIMVVVLCYKLRASKRITKQKDIALQELYRTMIQENVGPLPEEMKALPIEERTYYLPYKHDYEIDPANLEILEPLGSGHFGVVRKGHLQMADPKSQIEYKTRLTVAIKSATNPYDVELQQMMAEELKVMCAIPKHPNVLALIGAVTANIRKGQLLIVIEYVDGGCLREFLQQNRNVFVNELVDDDSATGDDSYMVPNSVKKKKYQFEDKSAGETDRLLSADSNSLCTSDLLSFGLQIANGMEWLASIPCVHRDLACRNVLVTKTKIVRIADFGLAKRHTNKTYYRVKKNKDTPLPVRWLPLESIEELKFTQKTDVWSFGICLYEIFTLGSTPYPGIDSPSVPDFIRSGQRNTQPEYCHDEIYSLMTKCWQLAPKDRPTFSDCIDHLKTHMQNCASELLDRVDKMLFVEAAEQMKLGEWIQKSRPEVPGAHFRKNKEKKQPPAEERYLIVESHA
ncbi:hypothetical protein CAEBREN_07717 [Caenorhabditis brenneri]|uniref:receptor protein-tyrosine kinase n=1 Tax=Caenorhabditis brenneri TaxID=135651 RepID=G0MHK3_CAEBE|nr:hypothetical protein CAEBREN_07717 [Caenorhabditis brenneri]